MCVFFLTCHHCSRRTNPQDRGVCARRRDTDAIRADAFILCNIGLRAVTIAVCGVRVITVSIAIIVHTQRISVPKCLHLTLRQPFNVVCQIPSIKIHTCFSNMQCLHIRFQLPVIVHMRHNKLNQTRKQHSRHGHCCQDVEECGSASDTLRLTVGHDHK